MRLAFGVSYFGCEYFGWQSQPHTHNTVQFHVDRAISKVANQKVLSVCAGRTDSGVHATNQVIHVDTHAIRKRHEWQRGVNKYLPKNIRINWVSEVADCFHARFSATYRRYQYIIADDSPHGSAFLNGLVLFYRQRLDVDQMYRAAQYLLGEQDFTSFRASNCQSKTPFRNIEKIAIYRNNNNIVVDIRANAFLYHMVRNIVGALLLVGNGKKPPAWMRQLLVQKNRQLAPPTAPPDGLYLVDVGYDFDEIPRKKTDGVFS